jgi:hypothetical protein
MHPIERPRWEPAEAPRRFEVNEGAQTAWPTESSCSEVNEQLRDASRSASAERLMDSMHKPEQHESAGYDLGSDEVAKSPISLQEC